jgi:cell division protein FtsX
LHRGYDDGLPGHGDIRQVRLFTVLALLVLIAACMNFATLSTARASQRTREIGVRKVVGATRRGLIVQFLGESFLMSLISLALALAFIEIIAPIVGELVGRPITLYGRGWLEAAVLLLGIFVGTAILSGTYPALLLSSLKPRYILSAAPGSILTGRMFRRILVVCQFAFSAFALLGVMVITEQQQYVQSRTLGFNPENLIYTPLSRPLRERLVTLKSELLSDESITAVSAGTMPAGFISSTTRWEWDGKDPAAEVQVNMMAVDEDYVETLQLELVAGSSFHGLAEGELRDAIIVNEAAVRAIGYENPIGRSLSFSTHWSSHPNARIIGVARDFHYGSLRDRIGPVILNFNPSFANYLCVRTVPGQAQGAIERMRDLWTRLSPESNFRYDFLDETISNLYVADDQLGSVFVAFAVLATCVACLGLFGLAAFTAERRRREISIRKIHGASVLRISGLLSKEFILLVAGASVIAWPVAYYATQKWLGEFAYHTEIGLNVFVLASVTAIVIAQSVVGIQTIRAAWANPIDALRQE